MTRCAIYIRKSRKEKDKISHRLQVQREQLPAHALAQGWTPEVYDDGHASAARGKIEDLKERARLEADIRAGRVEVILTIELSRLSRDDSLQDYVAWLHLCGEHNVRLATPARVLSPAQHSDWMLLLMEGGFSSVEMKILQARMAEGRNQARRAGRFLGGTCPNPYRYDIARKLPVIDPDQLPRYRQIWALAENHSMRAIIRETGLGFTTIRRAIAEHRLLFCQALRIDPQSGETIPTLWEPCLSPDQAARIKATRQRYEKKTTPGYRLRPGGLITSLGLSYCGHCGAAIHAEKFWKPRKDGSHLHHYQCGSNDRRPTCRESRLWPQWLIDDLIIASLCRTLGDTDHLKACWLASRGDDQTGPSLQGLDREEADLGAKKRRLIDAIAAGVIEFADARDKKNEIDSRLQTVRAERSKIIATRPVPDLDALALSREEFDQLDRETQRQILASALHRIEIYHGEITILYAFPITLKGGSTTSIPIPARFTRQPR